MESYEEAMFDQIRQALIDSGKTVSAISSESGVAYYTVVNIMKGNKERAYNPETYGKLKEYLRIQ